MTDTLYEFLVGLFVVVLGILFAFPFAWLLTVAWNGSVTSTFGWPTLDYWPAFWLLIVRSLLFPPRVIRVADRDR